MENSNVNMLVKTFIFTNILGILLSVGGFIDGYVAFDTTILLLSVEGSLFACVALANTPALKGVALAVFGLSLVAFMTSIEIPSAVLSPYIYTFMTLPSILALGGTLLELGKG